MIQGDRICRRSANGQAQAAPLTEEAQTSRHVTESTDFWPSPKVRPCTASSLLYLSPARSKHCFDNASLMLCQQSGSNQSHGDRGRLQLLHDDGCVALQRQPRTTDRISASTALLPPKLDTAQAAFQFGDSLPGPAQKPGTSSAGSEWQGEGMPASQPQQKLLPFVASAMALHAHAPSSRAMQALAQGAPAAEGEAEGQSEHADGAPEEQQVSASTASSTGNRACVTLMSHMLQDLEYLRPSTWHHDE